MEKISPPQPHVFAPQSEEFSYFVENKIKRDAGLFLRLGEKLFIFI